MTVSSPTVESGRAPTKRLVAVFIAALSLVLGPLAFAPAQAAASFTISGTIVGEGDFGPVDSAPVDLEKYDAETQSFEPADNMYTNEDGEYSFTAPGDETYRLHISSVYDFAPTYVNVGKLIADRLMDGTTLELAGSISGVVTEVGSPLPIEGAEVWAYRMNGATVDLADAGFEATDEDGVFSLAGLAAGVYQVKIEDYAGNHLMKVFNTVPVSKSTNTDLANIELAMGSEFSGTVLGSDSLAIEGASVFALRVTNGVADYSNAFTGIIDPSGAYKIGGLPGGDYKIQFTVNSDDPAYFEEFYNDKPTDETAELLSMPLGSLRSLGTTVLEKISSVTGVIEDAAGNALDDMGVEALKVTGGVTATEPSGFDYTQSDGTYEINPLHAGTYRLRFFDGNHVYADKAGPVITVAEGQIVSVPTTVMAKKPVVKPIPKKAATIKVSGKGGKKKVTLTISVKASGVTPTGKVTIKLGSKTLKTVTLKKGKATVTLTKQKKGKRAYKVIYSGDSKVLAKTVTTSKIKIK